MGGRKSIYNGRTWEISHTNLRHDILRKLGKPRLRKIPRSGLDELISNSRTLKELIYLFIYDRKQLSPLYPLGELYFCKISETLKRIRDVLAYYIIQYSTHSHSREGKTYVGI